MGITSVGPIYVILFHVGVARAFAGPASQALVPSLVDSAELQKAFTWSSTAWQVACIIGPAAGGALSGAVAGWGPVYATCAGLLGVSAVFAFAIRVRAQAPSNEPVTWATVLAGFRYVRTHRLILESISLDLCAVLLGGATALLRRFANDVLRAGPSGIGALVSALAVGAAAMAIFLALRPIRRSAGSIFSQLRAVDRLGTERP